MKKLLIIILILAVIGGGFGAYYFFSGRANERNIEEEVDIKMKIKLLLEKMKEVLKDRERTILELRFGIGGHKPKTQHEIASMMGISRSYVSRIETKAIDKLSKEIKE